GEIGEVSLQLIRDKHPFVNERLVGKAREVEIFSAFELPSIPDLLLSAATNDEQLAFEIHIIQDGRIAFDEDHAHFRLGALCRFTDHAVIRLYRTPAKHTLTF